LIGVSDISIVDDAPVPLGAHDGDDESGQFVQAEQVRLENLAQSAARQVFDGAGAGVGTIVVKRVERAAGFGQNSSKAGLDAIAVGIVDQGGVKAVGYQAVAIFLFAAACEDAPACCAQAMGGIIADAR